MVDAQAVAAAAVYVSGNNLFAAPNRQQDLQILDHRLASVRKLAERPRPTRRSKIDQELAPTNRAKGPPGLKCHIRPLRPAWADGALSCISARVRSHPGRSPTERDLPAHSQMTVQRNSVPAAVENLRIAR